MKFLLGPILCLGVPIALPQEKVDGVRVVSQILLSLENIDCGIIISLPVKGYTLKRRNGWIVGIFRQERLADGYYPFIILNVQKKGHRLGQDSLVHRFHSQGPAVVPEG